MSSALVTLTDEELLAEFRDAETTRRKAAAADQDRIAELEARGLAHTHGMRSTASFLSQLLRIPPTEGTARVKASRFLAEHRAITGQVVPALYPVVAAAQVAGEISDRHAAVVISTIERLPERVRHVHEDHLEVELVEHCRRFDPKHVGELAKRIVAHLDPDGVLKDADYRRKTRFLDIRRRPDGSAHVEGDLDVETAELLLAALAPFTAPAPADGQPDPRTPGQRRHDGLGEIIRAALRAKGLPTVGGVTTTVVVVAPIDALITEQGLVTTGAGAVIPAKEAKRWIGTDARFYASLIDKAKRPVSYSTGSARLFSETQRLILLARDGGCSMPGCDAPPAFCEAHHVIDHARGGPTSIDNATLLCRWHHHNFARLGWRCHMAGGYPRWTAPNWQDPSQTPRRNTAHHTGIGDTDTDTYRVGSDDAADGTATAADHSSPTDQS